MKTVQSFIDLGMRVVPIINVITRNELGKKVAPKFDGPWKELYLETPYNPIKNNEPIALTGAFITGEKSDAISIDCDNQETYDIFKAFDPEYKFIFESLGKKEGGASIIYALNDELRAIRAFSIHSDGIQLDYQTDNLLQYLPTSGNKSKVEWKAEKFEELPELKEPPNTVINYLKTLSLLNERSKKLTTTTGEVTNYAKEKHYKHLAPFIESFLKTEIFNEELFRILTPSEGGFRELEQYQKEKTLYPNNVPDGMGNAYITSMSGVLVCDKSISAKLFKEFILKVNNMWDNPYPSDKINAMISYQLSRTNWEYDKDWKESVNIVLTEYNTLIKLFYDPLTRIYYAIDNELGISTFNTVDAVPRHLNSIVAGGRKYKTSEIYDYLDSKKVILSAKHSYGNLEPNKYSNLYRFNMFKRSRAYSILINPEAYANEFEGKIPKITNLFFEHLIPDEQIRMYVLQFILTKLVTMQFSEVILYFLGTQGAGKNLFIDWLALLTENLAGKSMNEYQLVVEVDLENFLSKYNFWILNALFANLDEFGEKTNGGNEDKKILAQLKSYTGKETIQLRTMNNDPIPASHKCTFILTANENRLSPDLEDRRIVVIDTPNSLIESNFVKDLGGKSIAVQALFDEQELWCYYWATNYKQLSKDQYRTPPSTESKRKLIIKHLPPSKRIASIIKFQDKNMLIKLCEDNGLLQELIDDGKYGFISKDLLYDIFSSITAGTMAKNSMVNKELREMNLVPSKIRLGKKITYGFAFNNLKDWASKLIMEDDILLAKIEEEDIENKKLNTNE